MAVEGVDLGCDWRWDMGFVVMGKLASGFTYPEARIKILVLLSIHSRNNASVDSC